MLVDPSPASFDIWLTVYEVLTVLLPTLLVFAVISRYRNKHGISKGRENLVKLIILSVYCAAVLSVTGAGTLHDFLRTGFEYRPEQINLIPLIMDSYVAQYTLNIVMFVPLGFLLPLMWPRVAKIQWMALYGLGFSLVIELSQLLNQRATDIDDLLMNTLGALIGLAFFAALRKIGAIKRHEPSGKAALPALYLGVMFAGHFFFYDGLALVRLVYGY